MEYMSAADLPLLEVNDLHLSFGQVKAIDGVSFEVRKHELLAIIGPNGAGKTCIFNCINGFYQAQKGRICFAGQEIRKLTPHKIATLGISRVFQHIELFQGLSTVDNLMAARHIHMKRGVFPAAIYFGWTRREEIQNRKVVEKIIDFLEIQPIRDRLVGTLPYGMRKRVDLGRALAAEPSLLLLDEPMAGMNLEEKEDIARFIIDIQEEHKTTIILVEHDMQAIMDIAGRIIVIDFGREVAEGLPEEVVKNPAVIQAYLGKKRA
jgi:branched-chain amino acid transport system ATP-binding protein